MIIPTRTIRTTKKYNIFQAMLLPSTYLQAMYATMHRATAVASPCKYITILEPTFNKANTVDTIYNIAIDSSV